MSKEDFNKLIKRASRPVQEEQGKQQRPDGYNGKQTRSHKTGDTSGKRRGKSHPKTS